MEQVKVGDIVVISTNYTEKLGKVVRLTPTGSFAVDCMPGSLFNANGKLKGAGTYDRTSAAIATEEDVKRIREHAAINKALRICHNLQEKDITYEMAVELLKILGILKE